MRSASPSSRALALGALALALALGAGAGAARLLTPSGSAARPHAPRVAPAPTAFVPIAADGDDLSTGVQIERLDHPGFQFGSGGATLAVWVRDRAGAAPLAGARVWLTLAPRPFAPAAALLTTTTGARGRATITHLAPGQYALAAARPYIGERGAVPYALSSRPLTVGATGTATATLALARLPSAAGARGAGRGGSARPGVARNEIVVELNGVYADTWLDNPIATAPTIRRLAAAGSVSTQVWADYGWPLADDMVLATGGYPAWRLFDPWPRLVAWGERDGIDQATWYGQDGVPGVGASDFWGQDSVFDVARRFGLSTGWLGAATRRPLHLNGAALTSMQTLGAPDVWEGALARMLDRLERDGHGRGFLLYVDLAPPAAPQGEQETSPAAVGGRYGQTVSLYDAYVQVMMRQLAARHLAADTAVVLTAGEAQAGQTDAANYYGMGATGRGSSLRIPLIVVAPGVARGVRLDRPIAADAIAPTVTALLGLPPPAGARAPAVPLLASSAMVAR